MKKYLLLFTFCALLGCMAAACGHPTVAPQTGNTMVVNPIQQKASLDEINDAIGCNLKNPVGFTVSDERFSVITGTIGEYRFTIDGISYTLRASAAKDDISGVYVDGKTLGEAANASESGVADTIIFAEGMWTRWFDGDMQYSFLSSETGTQDTSTLYRVRDALR